MRGSRRAISIAAIVLFANACASPPPRLQPIAHISFDASRDTSQYVTYRELRRDDFRGVHPPDELRGYAKHMGAVLCGSIVNDGEPLLDVEAPTANGEVWFTFVDPNYRAMADPSCSWWNPESLAPVDYVLEHEQIHFALMELHARKINQEIRTLRIRVESREQAYDAAQANLNRVLQRLTRALVAENSEFDDQTSRTIDRKTQERWMHEVERRLSEPN